MKALMIFALLGFASVAQAERWGTAGCGLGALVYKDQPGKIQILAATTNNIVVPQTSAITSGTSGCYESRYEQASLYIKINHVALQDDIVRGQGEALSGLSQIYGCKSETEFANTLKANFDSIYKDADSQEVQKRIQSTLMNDETLSASCKIFS